MERLSPEQLCRVVHKCTGRKPTSQDPRVALKIFDEYMMFNGDTDTRWANEQAQIGNKRHSTNSSDPQLEHRSTTKKPSHLPLASDGVDDTSITTKEPNISEAKAKIPNCLADSLSGVCQGLGSIDSSLSENMGLLQLIKNGESPPKNRVSEALRRTESSIALLQGLLLGLKTTVDVLHSKNNANNALSADASPPNGRRETSTRNQVNSNIPRTSYASVVKNSEKPNPSKDTIKRRQQSRKAISEERSKIRCDERSVKFRPISANGIIEYGRLARAVGSLLGCGPSTKDLIQQIRLDRYGTYYVQLHEEKASSSIEKLLNLASQDGTILLDDLGKFSIFAPTSSVTLNKRPFVVHGIPMNLEEDQILTEIWSSNRERWNIPGNEDISSYLAKIQRLKRKLPKRDNSPGFDWTDSKSVKFFASPEIARYLTHPNKNFIVFDYQYLSVSPYSTPQKFCDNCGRLAHHNSSTCRLPTKCRFCSGPHCASQCPNKKDNIDFANRETQMSSINLDSNDCDITMEEGDASRLSAPKRFPFVNFDRPDRMSEWGNDT